MIIAIDAAKAQDKIQHPFKKKKTSRKKKGIKRNFSNSIKSIYENPTASVMLNVKHWRLSPWGQEQGKMSALITIIQHSTRSFTCYYKARKINKRRADWKEREKTVPVARWHYRLCRKPKTPRNNRVGHVTAYNINIQ